MATLVKRKTLAKRTETKPVTKSVKSSPYVYTELRPKFTGPQVKGVAPFRKEWKYLDPSGRVRLDQRLTAPGTYVVVDRGTGEFKHLVTVMPDGVSVGWSTCGGCHVWATLCKCPGGIQVPRAVESVYDRTVASMAGESWSVNHPAYQGSFRSAIRQERAERAERRTRADQGRTPIPVPDTPRKSLRKPSRGLLGGAQDSPDLATADKAAVEGAKDMLRQAERALGVTKAKPLRKRVR